MALGVKGSFYVLEVRVNRLFRYAHNSAYFLCGQVSAPQGVYNRMTRGIDPLSGYLFFFEVGVMAAKYLREADGSYG